MPSGCEGGNPALTESCTFVPPTCTSWDYSDWSACSGQESQTRQISASYPNNCTGGSPIISQSCNALCSEDTWSCGSWGQCQEDGRQTRSCSKTDDCSTIESPSPATSKSCTYVPTCTEDEWECGDWGVCTDNQQERTCTKSYDCPNTETAAPAGSRSCGKPSSDQLDEGKQRGIYQATVKLICPISYDQAYAGTGTIVSSDGYILTNKHVVDGTWGCLVGFITDYSDVPDFSGSVVADIFRVFGGQDVALIKIRDAAMNEYGYVNLAQGNGQPVSLGDTLLTFGYPAAFGKTLTYTSGVHSGVYGQYIKTTEPLKSGTSL
ncbi:serine protease [Patescibacteria group bacterium]